MVPLKIIIWKHFKKDIELLVKGFYSVGLQINLEKTKFMCVLGGTPPKPLSHSAYHRMVTKEGLTYKQKQQLQIQCPVCAKNLKQGSLKSHFKRFHQNSPFQTTTQSSIEINNSSYNVNMPNYNTYYKCPVPSCPGGAKGKFNMYRHFCNMHPNANLIISQDGQLQRCPLCQGFAKDMLKHQQTERCKLGQQKGINTNKLASINIKREKTSI